MKRKLFLAATVVLISLLHYFTPVRYHYLHPVYQRLYYIPVVLGAYWFGLRGGLAFALLSGLAYAPHIFFQWSVHPHERFTQYVEIVMFVIVGSLVGILSNIQRLQHEQLENAQQRIRRLDRLSLLGQLAAGLAHEIRNPLASLVGSAQILEESIGPGHRQREFLDILSSELVKLEERLNVFLKFARPARPEILPNNINDVVRASVALVEKQAAQSGCRLAMELDDAVPLAPMDAEQLKEVLLNLLLNACQAMSGGGQLTVRTRAERGGICFSVRDEGPGIGEDEIEKIFEPFYTTKKTGTGLGLAIVKQLVEGQNGSISVVPAERGACFEVRIPYA